MKNEQKIDLKQRLSELDEQSLNGSVAFTAQALSDSNLNELAVMAEMLERIGISVEINRKENSGTGLAYDFIVMKINEEKYKTAMTRHAGRKADFNKKYDTYGKCTVAELEEKLLVMSKTKIAQELGCSRMTLYRIIKNIAVQKPVGDTSIWHYTS